MKEAPEHQLLVRDGNASELFDMLLDVTHGGRIRECHVELLTRIDDAEGDWWELRLRWSCRRRGFRRGFCHFDLSRWRWRRGAGSCSISGLAHRRCD